MEKLTDDFKEAVRAMPTKEKDKLLLRLVAKDKLLVKKLTFQLLEAGETLEDREEELKELISRILRPVTYNTPGYLLVDMRTCNARITEHIKITKDKLGEVQLTLFMLKTAFENHMTMLRSFPTFRARTFKKYVITRIKAILKKAEKLHEDLHMEFEEDMNVVLEYIYQFRPTADLALEEGVPKRWE